MVASILCSVGFGRRHRFRVLALAVLLSLCFFVGGTGTVIAAPQVCEDGPQTSGATYRICMPGGTWNGDLLVYAHGYVSPTRPIGIPEDQMTLPGTSLTVDQIANLQGYGFVMSGYADNGLAVRQGLADLVDAVSIFVETHGEPGRVIVVGASEGGLIASLAVEEHADIFDGALALCGTYGDYAGQTDYLGDFRVLFDYYFPALLPASAVDIPQTLLDSWDATFYPQEVQPVVEEPGNADTVGELFGVANVAHDAADSTNWGDIVGRLLWYNVHATNDAIVKLDGQPFNNPDRLYSGSSDDELLNQNVARYTADAAARATIAADYETSGDIRGALVTVHTTNDPLAPNWHAQRYREKIEGKGRTLYHQHIEIDAYGHCAFSSSDVLAAVGTLTSMLENPPTQTYLPVVMR